MRFALKRKVLIPLLAVFILGLFIFAFSSRKSDSEEVERGIHKFAEVTGTTASSDGQFPTHNQYDEAFTRGRVHYVTIDNIDQVLGCSEPWMIKFFNPRCPHCIAIESKYQEAAGMLENDNVHVGEVNCVDEKELCRRYNIRGVPTIMMSVSLFDTSNVLFCASVKGQNSTVQFKGSRTPEEFAAFARNAALLQSFTPPSSAS